MAKQNRRQTKIKHTFGAFEIRISDEKVEIEDRINKLRKFVYSNQTFEYTTFTMLLSEAKTTENGIEPKTEHEKTADTKNAEFMVYMLYNTQHLFTNEEFRNKYQMALVDMMNVELADDDESEEEILENLKSEYEAKEVLDREVQGKDETSETSHEG